MSPRMFIALVFKLSGCGRSPDQR